MSKETLYQRLVHSTALSNLSEGLGISYRSWANDLLQTMKEITGIDRWKVMQSFQIPLEDMWDAIVERLIAPPVALLNLNERAKYTITSASLQDPSILGDYYTPNTQEIIVQCLLIRPSITLPLEPKKLPKPMYIGIAVLWLDTYRGSYPETFHTKWVPVHNQQELEAAEHEIAHPAKLLQPLSGKIRAQGEPVWRFDAERRKTPNYKSSDQLALSLRLKTTDRFNPKTGSGQPQQWSGGNNKVLGDLPEHRKIAENVYPKGYGGSDSASYEQERRRALDPNTNFEDLMDLAYTYPSEVSQNPVMLMLSLEDPGKYKDLLDIIRKNSSNNRNYEKIQSSRRVNPIEFIWKQAYEMAKKQFEKLTKNLEQYPYLYGQDPTYWPKNIGGSAEEFDYPGSHFYLQFKRIFGGSPSTEIVKKTKKLVQDLFNRLVALKHQFRNKRTNQQSTEYALRYLGNETARETYHFEQTILHDNNNLTESPIEIFAPIGNWEKNSGFKDVDRRIVTSSKAVEKIKAQWNKTPYNFDLYFANLPRLNKPEYTEVGEVDLKFVRWDMQLDLMDIPNIHQDAITVIFTNNKGDERVMFTGWIMAHRLGHALRLSRVGSGQTAGLWQEYVQTLDKLFNEILSNVYEVNPTTRGMFGVLRQNDVALKLAAQQLGTMKSARDQNLRTWFEFAYELFAQYLLTGKITFNPLPEVLQTGYGAFGRKVTKTAGALERENFNIERYRDALENSLKRVLNSAVGKIFVM